MFSPALLRYFERGVFICCCAAGSEFVSVNFITLYWQICGKNECRLICGKVWYGIITELLFKRLIQTTKHKCRFHDHFSKFLFTAIYEFETRKRTCSAWQLFKEFGSLCNLAPFVICQPFNIILDHSDYVSDRPFQCEITSQNCKLSPKSEFSGVFSPSIYTFSWLSVSLTANILCLTVWPEQLGHLILIATRSKLLVL